MTERDFAAWKALIPTLTQTTKPQIPAVKLPYSGPHYGPSHTSGPDKCLTAKALKRALYRMGIETSFSKPDEHYNLKLEQAMGRWQAPLGIPATGQYGEKSYESMRSALAPDGSYAMDETAQRWIRKEVEGAVQV